MYAGLVDSREKFFARNELLGYQVGPPYKNIRRTSLMEDSLKRAGREAVRFTKAVRNGFEPWLPVKLDDYKAVLYRNQPDG